MALRCNGNMFQNTGIQHFGATILNSAYPHVLQQNFAQTNRIRNLTAGEGITSDLVGLPSGNRHPSAWMMPQKAGAIAARNTITGAATFTATAQSGYNIAATVTGDGGIPPCSIGLIVSIAATLEATGGITSAQLEALASIAATITGSSSVTATAAGLADLAASIAGAGLVNANNTALMDIAATIRGYSELTPEGIRDNVWGAILANYQATGTAGKALSSAAVGGVDYNLLAQAVWEAAIDGGYTAEELMRLMSSAMAGKVSGAEGTTTIFRDITDTKDRITATVDTNGNRTAITLDAT